MRILFISFNDVKDEKYGGGQCSRRNLEALRKYGNVEVICIRKKNEFQSLKSIITGCFPPLGRKKAKEIVCRAKREKYSLVFLDSSLLGFIGKRIKEINSSINVFVFFHNVEYDYIDVHIRKGIKQYIYKCLAKKHEGYSLTYADKIITLNIRDDNRLNSLYHRGSDCILPISFDDKFVKKEGSKRPEPRKPIALFVGSYGRANYEGIKWFIQNSKILNKIDLKIVGKDFECVRAELEAYSCSVIGTVDDMSSYYAKADFVISPILSGGGMKVKIAEALMYGKTVFGTKEALEGYTDETGKSLYLCEDIDDFDNDIINWIDQNNMGFNKESRRLYLEKYNSAVVEEKIGKLMKQLDEGKSDS